MIRVFPQYLTSPHILDPKYLNTHKEVGLVTPLDDLMHSQHFEESSRGGPKALATLGAFPLPGAGSGSGRASSCIKPRLWHWCMAASPWKSPSFLPSVRGGGA